MDERHVVLRCNVALVLAIAALAIPAGTGQQSDMVWAEFEQVRLSPAEVRSGEEFTLSMAVRNILDVEMEDMHLELVAARPFEPLGGAYVYLGSMAPNATAPASFALCIDEGTPSGTYPLQVLVTMEATAAAVQGSRFLEMKTAGYSFAKLVNVRVHGAPEVVGAVSAGDVRDVHPGDRFTATIRLVNNGTDTADDLWVEAQATDALGVEWGFARQFVGALPPGAAAAVTVAGTVADGADPGEHRLPVALSWSRDKRSYSGSLAVPVAVRPSEPVLAVSGVASNPGTVVPGDAFTLSVRVVNAATDPGDRAEDVALTLASAGDVAVDAAGATQVIGTLAGGAQAPATFGGTVSPGAAPGERGLPLAVSWKRDGRAERLNVVVPLGVAASSPALSVAALETRPAALRPGEPFTLVLRVVNTGSAPQGKALDVRVAASSTDDFRLYAAGREQVLGAIPPGGSATATLAGEVADDAASGDHAVPVSLVHRSGRVDATVALSVEDAADFSLAGANPPLLRDDRRQPVSFTLRNTGTAVADEIALTLMAAYPITPSGRTAHVPRLAPGEEAAVVFHVDIDAEATPQAYPLEVAVAWSEGRERTRRQMSVMVPLEVSPDKAPFVWSVPAAVALFIAAAVAVRHLVSRRARTSAAVPAAGDDGHGAPPARAEGAAEAAGAAKGSARRGSGTSGGGAGSG